MLSQPLGKKHFHAPCPLRQIGKTGRVLVDHQQADGGEAHQQPHRQGAKRKYAFRIQLPQDHECYGSLPANDQSQAIAFSSGTTIRKPTVLGDDVARGLGINVKTTRLAALSIAAILIGAAVTLAGPAGFIGLIAPHLARRSMGESIRLQFISCPLGGPFLMLLADVRLL